MSGWTSDAGKLSPERPEGLIDRLLSILGEVAVDADALKTTEFRSRIQSYRKRLSASYATPDFAGYATDCLRTCEEYFNLTRKYMAERESAFGEIIQVLRESISVLAGESTNYNTQLARTTDRFDRLVEIEDIRKLKRQISLECVELKRIVTEKQQKDEESYSRLNRRVELLQGSLEQTREEASMDSLTRVANRAAFDKTLAQWIASHNAAKKPFILAMLDLDNFKAINDRHGHQIGDRVLLCAAQWFKKWVRTNDFLARFGGEEFAILLSDVSTDQAQANFKSLLENIAVANYKYTVAGEEADVSFTVSCGIAEFVPQESAENLIRRADSAMYEAKHRGKNCGVVADLPHKSRGIWSSLQPLIPFKI